MSDHSHSESPPAQNLFTPSQIKQFDRDDAEAGEAIGKMLSIFFLYTVLVMTVSAVATWWWTTNVTVR